MTNQSYSLEDLRSIIHENYKNSWLKFILQFTALGKLLNQNQGSSNDKFLQCFLSSWSLMQWIFKQFLQDKPQINKFNEIVGAKLSMQQNDFTSQRVISQSHSVVLEQETENNTLNIVRDAEQPKVTLSCSSLLGARYMRFDFFPLNDNSSGKVENSLTNTNDPDTQAEVTSLYPIIMPGAVEFRFFASKLTLNNAEINSGEINDARNPLFEID